MSDSPTSEYGFSLAETAIEGTIIAVLLLGLQATKTGWAYYWIFYVSISGVMVLSVLRIAATQAEDPRWILVRATIQWSSFLMQVTVLGILAGAAVKATREITWVTSAVWMFTGISVCSILIIVLVDQVFLREYVGFWADTIRSEVGDDPIGRLLRQMANTGEQMTEDGLNSGADHEQQDTLEVVKLGISFLIVLAVVSAPIWYFSGSLFGSSVAAFAALISLLIIRDAIRYLYLSFGPAEFEELKTGVALGFLIRIIQILMVAEILGYEPV